MAEQDKSSRQSIIQTVQTPLGFFVLVVLIVEIILGVLASSSEGSDRTYMVVGMLGLIFLLVIIVALLAAFRPQALQGTPPVATAGGAQTLPQGQPEQAAKPGPPVPAEEQVEPLGSPAQNKAGILVDLSHGQDKWGMGSIFELAGDTLIHMIVPPPAQVPWDIRAIRDSRQLCSQDLARWRGLLLGLPHHQAIDEGSRQAIVAWVRAGGRLALLGFELSDRHHGANLNALAEAFGLRFNTDIVAPKGWKETAGKPYGAAVEYKGIEASGHALMQGVERLSFHNLCTLTVEPGAQVLLALGNHGISQIVPETAHYVDGELKSGDLRYEVIDEAPWVPLIAESPAGLTGQGKVVAVGTWDLLGGGYKLTEETDNLLFLRNLLAWLGS